MKDQDKADFGRVESPSRQNFMISTLNPISSGCMESSFRRPEANLHNPQMQRKETLYSGLLEELMLDSRDVLNELRNYRDFVVSKYEPMDQSQEEPTFWAALPELGLEGEEALCKEGHLSLERIHLIHLNKRSSRDWDTAEEC